MSIAAAAECYSGWFEPSREPSLVMLFVFVEQSFTTATLLRGQSLAGKTQAVT
jgi:hypothetical protein